MPENHILECWEFYLESMRIAAGDVDYQWDEWRVINYFQPLDDGLLKELSAITPNALVAFGGAIAYWIYLRLRRASQAPKAAKFLEVATSSTMEEPLFDYFEVDVDDWRGPENGPLAVAITALVTALHDRSQIHFLSHKVHYLYSLACHVTDPSNAFRTWFTHSLVLQKSNHTLSEERPEGFTAGFFDDLDFMGSAVPLSEFILNRSFLRADKAFTFAQQRAAISRSNPYLVSR